MLAPRDVRPRPSPWLSAGLLCAALLLLPALAWFLVPRPAAVTTPPRPRVEVTAATSVARDEPPPPPRPRPSAEAEVPAAESPVSGVVLDPEGRPAKGAFVGCDDRDRMLATTTDERGSFTLPPSAAGCLVVSNHPDFMPSERVEVTAGRRNTVRLSRGGGIDGEVLDERGAPVASFMLGVESYLGTGPAADRTPIGDVKSFRDPRGAFLWENLPPGRYVLTASAEGRPPARSRAIEVDLGRVTRNVRISLPRGALLRGVIVDAETRKPIAGATIALDSMTSTSANLIQPARSDEGGAYALEGVPAGPFSIRVSHERYRTKIVPGLVTRGAASITHDVDLKPRVDGGPADEFAGIGAMLAPAPGGVTIGLVMAGGPAESGGLLAGDRILRIDGDDATLLPLADCVQRLRGPDGSRVSITLARKDGATVEVNLTRRVIVR